MDTENIYHQVQSHYGLAAQMPLAESKIGVAKAFGYSEDDLSTIPDGSNLGLSCGNPLAIASLRKGETVIDLGSGAGFDVFQAASKVGSTGRVIGIDMNSDMIDRALANMQKIQANNVEFLQSRITSINLPHDTANCVISNCVINLVPEEHKHLVFDEMFRVLKPGGRVAISDTLSKKDLPQHIRSSMALYVGCIGGASTKQKYENYLNQAGFQDITILDANIDLNVFLEGEKGVQTKEESSQCCIRIEKSFCGQEICNPSDEDGECCRAERSAENHSEVDGTKDLDLNEWIGSYKIFAVKPE